MPYKDRMMAVLDAQARNLARIAPGLALPGTDASGDPIVLVGPAPDLVRLADTPFRLIEQTQRLANSQRVITLLPVSDNSRAQIDHRNDRVVTYLIYGWCRLTKAEEMADLHADYAGSPLAEKLDAFIYDLKSVFYSNLLLIDPQHQSGMVQDAALGMSFEERYPMALVKGTVVCSYSDGPC